MKTKVLTLLGSFLLCLTFLGVANQSSPVIAEEPPRRQVRRQSNTVRDYSVTRIWQNTRIQEHWTYTKELWFNRGYSVSTSSKTSHNGLYSEITIKYHYSTW